MFAEALKMFILTQKNQIQMMLEVLKIRKSLRG